MSVCQNCRNELLCSSCRAPHTGPKIDVVDIVFDGPPSEVAGFVEVENMNREGIKVGQWQKRNDGYWVLRLKVVR